MNLVNFIKPTIDKIAVSSVIPLLLLVSNKMQKALCFAACTDIQYEKWPNIISSPCGCIIGSTFSEFVSEAVSVIILPFIITYLVYSIFGIIIERYKKKK